MAELSPPKRDKMARLIAFGSHYADAYEKAGYKPSRSNAHVMASDPDFVARVEELKTADLPLSKDPSYEEWTLQAARNIHDARHPESGPPQLAAVNKSLELIAKSQGWLKDSVEVTDKTKDPEEIVAKLKSINPQLAEMVEGMILSKDVKH